MLTSCLMLLQAKLARVFEVCEQQWEVYDPLGEEYDLLLACMHRWQARARHKKEKRHQTQQQNCADAFRHACFVQGIAHGTACMRVVLCPVV